MTLLDVCANLDDFDDDGVIYARRDAGDFTPDSEAMVLSNKVGDGKPSSGIVLEACQGFTYCLEIFIAKEAVHVWSLWRQGRKPNAAEAAEAVCHKANFDAWGPPNFPIDTVDQGG